jgi:tRNA1Val (adenine37-N6)-methyltransferase
LSSGIALTTTEDLLLGGAMRLRQPAKGYRLTSDAVLLAACVPLQAGQRILELGTGYGQVSLCLLAREPDLQVTGVEKNAAAAALARQNAELNGVVEKFSVIEGNIAAQQLQGFHAVLANPPYRQAGTHTASDDPIKAAATTEVEPLALWCQVAANALLPDGAAYFIHDARRQDELVTSFKASGLGALCVVPLVPKQGQPANRILVRARAGQGMQIFQPLALHEDDGKWRAEIERVLRTPLWLSIWPD